MKNRLFYLVGIALTVVALLLGALLQPQLNGQFASTALAQSNGQSNAMPGTITVIGEGKVRIKPDIARAQIGVEVLMDSVKAASDANKERLEAVLAALREQGIAEEDIQTTGFSVYAERFGFDGPLPEDQINYRVSNNVTVIVRELDTLGTVLDVAIEAGANNIYGVEFSIDDPSVVESSARESAVADAKAKAEELAALTGTTVGNVVAISEVIGNGGGFYSSNFAEAARAMGGGGSTPVSPGELELIMQLQITYAIAQ